LTYAQNPCCGAHGCGAGRDARYKSHSAAKLLILLGLFPCRFCRHSSQGLDFSGLAAFAPAPINKVVHRNHEQLANRFEINDLAALSNVKLKK
jgi:hypothetical protein